MPMAHLDFLKFQDSPNFGADQFSLTRRDTIYLAWEASEPTCAFFKLYSFCLYCYHKFCRLALILYPLSKFSYWQKVRYESTYNVC